MFVNHCSSCRYDCKSREVCEKYKRIATNTAGPPEYADRGRPIGHALLRGKFEAPYHRELRETSEHYKWLAEDYMNLIKKYWRHDTRKGGDLEVLANAILNTHDSLWNSGDPNGRIDENMPEEERQNIYWKKTLTAYPYALLDKINEEKRTYNTMITGVPIEAANEESEEEDAGIKVEKLFKWMDEHLWDLAKDETVEKTYENGKMSRRVIQGTTPEQRRKNFEMALEAMKLHYISGIDYRKIAKMFGKKYGQDINGAVLRLFPIIAEHEEEIFSK